MLAHIRLHKFTSRQWLPFPRVTVRPRTGMAGRTASHETSHVPRIHHHFFFTTRHQMLSVWRLSAKVNRSGFRGEKSAQDNSCYSFHCSGIQVLCSLDPVTHLGFVCRGFWTAATPFYSSCSDARNMQFTFTLGRRGADSRLGIFDGILLLCLAILLNGLGVSACTTRPMSIFGLSEHASLDSIRPFSFWLRLLWLVVWPRAPKTCRLVKTHL